VRLNGRTGAESEEERIKILATSGAGEPRWQAKLKSE